MIFHSYVSLPDGIPFCCWAVLICYPFSSPQKEHSELPATDQARADPTLKDLTQRSAADIAESWRGDAGRNLQNGDGIRRIWWDFVGYVFKIFYYILIYVCHYIYIY
jgi:hypothetical protein